MAIQLIALPPEAVQFDEERFPDHDQSYIFEHLLHYLSLMETLPAIQILVNRDRIVVTRRQKYLRIALILKRPEIRAVIDPSSDAAATAALKNRPGVEELDWDEIDTLERATPVFDNWHVFFFERPLTPDEKAVFEAEIVGFFEDLRHPASADGDPILCLRYDDNGPYAEFLARTPVGDESWYASFLAAVKRFSSRSVRVISYQGRRFDG